LWLYIFFLKIPLAFKENELFSDLTAKFILHLKII